jgi:hypothetical protein
MGCWTGWCDENDIIEGGIEMKQGIIVAEVKKGRYKDSQIELEIGSSAMDSLIKINGKRFDWVQAVHIHIKVGEPTKMVIMRCSP